MKIFRVTIYFAIAACVLSPVYAQTGDSIAINNPTSVNPDTINPDEENSYWQANYSSRPYYDKDKDYALYAPAYKYGVDLYKLNPGKRYEELDQVQLRNDWNRNQHKEDTGLVWGDAQAATRDAYNRIYEANHKNDLEEALKNVH
jgi:hypothetical protein